MLGAARLDPLWPGCTGIGGDLETALAASASSYLKLTSCAKLNCRKQATIVHNGNPYWREHALKAVASGKITARKPRGH